MLPPLDKNVQRGILGCMDGEMKEGNPIETKPVTTLSFRELAKRVATDTDLADPFINGIETDSETSTEDREALKAVLTEYYEYSLEDIRDIDAKTCQFTGRAKQSIAIKSGHDDRGTPYLEFTVGGNTTEPKPRRIVSHSLKRGAPLAIALANQPDKLLSRIFDNATSTPEVIELGQLSVSKTNLLGKNRDSTWALQGNIFTESVSIIN